MDNPSTLAESEYQDQQQPSPLAIPPSASDSFRADSLPSGHPAAPFPAPLYFLPILLPPQPSVYQVPLLHDSKLAWPSRGGGGHHNQPGGLPLGPQPLLPRTKTASSRHRSSSKVSHADNTQSTSTPGTQNCHGHRPTRNSDTADRALITNGREMASKSSGKRHGDAPSASQNQSAPPRQSPQSAAGATGTPAHSSSVPSTPHQYARKFSFESREPSPGANQSHSPRSAYSETNSTLPSLRPLPPRLSGCRFETALAHSRRRMNYSLGSDKLEKVPLDKIKSRLTEEEEAKLTADMRELYQKLLPTAEVEKNRQKLVQKLEKLFNDEWPGHNIRVHLFGSSGNLLCSDDSDVDICITTEWKELEGVCRIAELLAKHGMEKVVCVSSAKVPIVKIWDPELGLACDMNVNNTLALENTRMVRTYVEVDERVRPLAMIIKHWTRKRIVNDAAFGGTLSSYAWICMIIAFLQLRDPPVLPALHQQRYKSTRPDGTKSAFADDLEKLRGFGRKNKDGIGALLFQFFRFYAHEFDYDKFALSVRLGKLLTKTEKNWQHALNNCLCVEEPFNTVRNLGNTADDTSFRGLHLELRRAFDLIAQAKLEECCEQYVFPKEEERIWQKPAPVPRPVLVRSSSQQHANRGGRGGFRGGSRQFHRNGNSSNRRASSSVAYDGSSAYVAQGLTPSLSAQDAQFLLWHAQQQAAMQPDLFGPTLNALQAQENHLRFHLFTQQQALQQHQALAHAQRMQGGGPSQATDRSRTNSFDSPPLTAPIRPEIAYFYPPYSFQPAPYFAHVGTTTYPSSPSATASGTMPEFRRSLHRTAMTTESGASTGGGTLRSQSQPASRSSMSTGPVGPGSSAPAEPSPALTSAFPPRQVNGIPIPSFIPDEGNDLGFDDSPSKSASNTPPDDEGPRYVGFYVNDATNNAGQQQNGVATGIPAFGDLVQGSSSGRRRLSTDQLPQSILDRRMGRPSRSPSPLGHARAFSVGTSSAPLASAPFAASGSKLGPSRGPLVVNGTRSSGAASSSRQQPAGEAVPPPSSATFDNPLRIGSWSERIGPPPPPLNQTSPETGSASKDRPLVVNGSISSPPAAASSHGFADPHSFGHRIASMGGLNIGSLPPINTDGFPDMRRFSPSARSNAASRHQQNGIAPLDLAIGEYNGARDFQHLSPVYENRTPPAAVRKADPLAQAEKPPAMTIRPSTPPSDAWDASSRPERKPAAPAKSQQTAVSSTAVRKDGLPNPPAVANPRVNGISKENGHTRSAKSESEGLGGGWQKPKNRKKGIADLKGAANAFSHGEQPPRNESERKGG